MNRSILFAASGILMFGFSPVATATTINFDDVVGGPTVLTTQYASSGVVFSQITRSQTFPFNIVPPSPPNYASPFYNTTNPGFIDFVNPLNSSIPAYAATVSFTLVGLTNPPGHPGNFSGATIDALDLFGNVIAGQTQVIAPAITATSNQILTFSGQVSSLRFTLTPGTSGLLPIDDLTFGALTSAPEPSTGFLAFGMVAAICLLRRTHS